MAYYIHSAIIGVVLFLSSNPDLELSLDKKMQMWLEGHSEALLNDYEFIPEIFYHLHMPYILAQFYFKQPGLCWAGCNAATGAAKALSISYSKQKVSHMTYVRIM